MAKQEQHAHACGFRLGQRCAKFRLRANIQPYLGGSFHLDHKGYFKQNIFNAASSLWLHAKQAPASV